MRRGVQGDVMRIRYLLKFQKTGNLKFIGHLDLLRLIHRLVRLAEIDIDYSKGFNPHMLVTIAQPLPVGMQGQGELCVFETKTQTDTDIAMAGLNAAAPGGLSFTGARAMPENEKSPASLIRAASYEVLLNGKSIDLTLPCGSVKNVKPSLIIQQQCDETGESYLPHKISYIRKQLYKLDCNGGLVSIF